MMDELFQGRLGLQQRVIPSYRAVFFDALAQSCVGGLNVFAGMPLNVEGIEPAERLQKAQLVMANNRYFLDPSSPFFLCWQGKFVDWLESWQPEVLIIEANPRYPDTRKAIQWMKAKKRKVIGWGLGAPPITGLFSGIRKRERLRLLHSLDAVIAYSRQGAEQYQRLGFPSERIYVASNAVAPSPKIPPQQKPVKAGEQLTVLFVGRLQWRKRLDLLLRACSKLPMGLQPRLLIVGEGPAQRELEELAHQAYPSAEFCGAKYGDELKAYFDRADLFVLPGTGGLAIQQAMAYGLPVIVAKGDGTQDDLVRSENGWLVAPDDLQTLTLALTQALSNPNKLPEMGIASYRIVADEINIEKMVKVFLQAIRETQKNDRIYLNIKGKSTINNTDQTR
jgi:glycosyltransferase involved in cell wall biosynthesis